MRKRRESDQKKPKEMKIPSRKTCFIVLFLLVLCSWMIPSIAVYGDLMCQEWIVLIPADLI